LGTLCEQNVEAGKEWGSLCGQNAEVAKRWAHTVGKMLHLQSAEVGGIGLYISTAFIGMNRETENIHLSLKSTNYKVYFVQIKSAGVWI
jgi:uncharacterized membrane-anchored protein